MRADVLRHADFLLSRLDLLPTLEAWDTLLSLGPPGWHANNVLLFPDNRVLLCS
jgi:cysteinyl-tRNA synthetase